jgi:hypothetical protein
VIEKLCSYETTKTQGLGDSIAHAVKTVRARVTSSNPASDVDVRTGLSLV